MSKHKQPKLRQITLQNLLSFGPGAVPLALEPLNVLIGPNASGKSNLIEAVSLLRAAPISGRISDRDIRGIVRRGGGIEEWIWKGAGDECAQIEAEVDGSCDEPSLRHVLKFRRHQQLLLVEDENISRKSKTDTNDFELYSRVPKGQNYAFLPAHAEVSILAERRDPENYPELEKLASFYEGIRIFRDWEFGRIARLREPKRADMRNDRLEEDFSNLGLILSRLRRKPAAKNAIIESLKDLYAGFDDFDVNIEGGFVQVVFTEGDFSVPATRLSDGTLRYLCLLTILCDPEPPPLICIEEPELGLHPDILPKLADLLVDASHRTQLIVTTHSDILVDALTSRPEAIVICEKHNGITSMRRLRQEDLTDWISKYRLGELWTRGQLGGTRW